MMFAVLALLLAVAPPSSECVGCHDAQVAKAMGTSHPVAIDYVQAIAANSRRYRSAASASDYLVDGKVECVSCHLTHDAETENPFRLRTRDIVKLCTACHVISD